jgi:hypothetical protein
VLSFGGLLHTIVKPDEKFDAFLRVFALFPEHTFQWFYPESDQQSRDRMDKANAQGLDNFQLLVDSDNNIDVLLQSLLGSSELFSCLGKINND